MPQALPTNIKASKTKHRPPVGAILLAGLSIVTGLFLFGDRIFSLVRAYSIADRVTIHPSYYVDRIGDAVTATTAILGAMGLFLGRRWGWWIGLYHCYWRIAYQSILPMAHSVLAITLSDPATAPRREFSSALFSGVMFGLFVFYLMREKVMSFYGVEITERWRATGIGIGMSFPFATGIYLLSGALQRHISILPPSMGL
jgi:hypothetical protein